MIGAGDNNPTSGRGIVAAVVLASRNNPRQERGDENSSAEKNDRMWETDARQAAAILLRGHCDLNHLAIFHRCAVERRRTVAPRLRGGHCLAIVAGHGRRTHGD